METFSKESQRGLGFRVLGKDYFDSLFVPVYPWVPGIPKFESAPG